MVHTEDYIQCITLIYYTYGMVHTEAYIQCITLMYYTHDMVHTEVYIQINVIHCMLTSVRTISCVY
jgi:hypothetical protein